MVPEYIAAAVRDKQHRDDIQTAELVSRGTPPDQATTGIDGGARGEGRQAGNPGGAEGGRRFAIGRRGLVVWETCDTAGGRRGGVWWGVG